MSHPSKTYDAIVIGAGQAGPGLAARLAGEGKRVALVERKRFGGTCVNVGCIPTKSLIASARLAYVVQILAPSHGITTGAMDVDIQKVMERVDEVTGYPNREIPAWMQETQGLEVFHDHARFLSPRSLAVGEQVLEAERIFLNVGARARRPDLPGLDEVPTLTNSTFFELYREGIVPDHLLIIGGSYLGLEFAQIARRFGSKVTVVEQSNHLLPKEDEDISEALQEILESEGIDIHVGAKCLEVARAGEGVVARMERGGEEQRVQASHLLLATGRTPNTDDLGLEHTRIETDQRGYIQVDKRLATTQQGVWAMGDCRGGAMFTHTAVHDQQVVESQLLGDGSLTTADRFLTYALFVDPPLGRVGQSERQVREAGTQAKVLMLPMKAINRARAKGETKGFFKVVVDAVSDRILGAAALGVECDEVIHVLTTAMYAKMTWSDFTNAVFIHPTVAELLPWLSEERTIP